MVSAPGVLERSSIYNEIAWRPKMGTPGDASFLRPIAAIRHEQKKSRQAAVLLLENSKKWQSGDDADRISVGWATSEYTSVLRAHLERLKNLIFPLLEQTLTEEGEVKIIDEINRAGLNWPAGEDPEKYAKNLLALEEELSDWK